MVTQKQKKVVIMMPEGRLINHSLFEKDVYVDPKTSKEGMPSYKVEMVYEPGQVQGEGTVEDTILDFLEETLGNEYVDLYMDGKVPGPFVDGNEKAKAREKKGKAGDAYAGRVILRSNTQYNKDGVDGPGGVQVFGPAVEKIGLLEGNSADIYPGCYGVLAGTLHVWGDPDTKDWGVKVYLSAFQKTRDGERIVPITDHSTLFEPAKGAAAEAPARRRR